MNESPLILTRDQGDNHFHAKLAKSNLFQAVSDHNGRWMKPILLSGANQSDEIEYISAYSRFNPLLKIESFRNVKNARPFREDAALFESIFNFTFASPPRGSGRIGNILDMVGSGENPDKVIDFFFLRSREIPGIKLYSFDNFVNRLAEFTLSSTIITSFNLKHDLFPALLTAIWLQRASSFPLIIQSNRSVTPPIGGWTMLEAVKVPFTSFMTAVTETMGIENDDVEKAYRVWQLSRTEVEEKQKATTPRFISVENVNSFLRVLSASHSDVNYIVSAKQRPAPVMFDQLNGTITLRAGHSAKDNDSIAVAGAKSVRRHVERIYNDGYVGNLIPATREVFPVIIEILSRIILGNFSDGDIVELGLEFNALQWDIDAVKESLNETTVGEIVGLFSSEHLFMSRFPIWGSFTSEAGGAGVEKPEIASFQIARELLRSARTKDILSADADTRVGVILSRSPSENSPPSLQTGLVRAGENLAAVALTTIGEAMKTEISQIGKSTAEEGVRIASGRIRQFLFDNSKKIAEFAQLGKLPWLRWGSDLISNLPDLGSFS